MVNEKGLEIGKVNKEIDSIKMLMEVDDEPRQRKRISTYQVCLMWKKIFFSLFKMENRCMRTLKKNHL